MAKFGFEYRSENGWSADHCGEQNDSNYFASREAAEAELPNLARCMSVTVDDLRVVEIG